MSLYNKGHFSSTSLLKETIFKHKINQKETSKVIPRRIQHQEQSPGAVL